MQRHWPVSRLGEPSRVSPDLRHLTVQELSGLSPLWKRAEGLRADARQAVAEAAAEFDLAAATQRALHELLSIAKLKMVRRRGNDRPIFRPAE